jgi:hypothetical protein
MATFREMKAKYETPANRGFAGNILSSLTQPFRRAYESAKYAASAPGGYKPMFDSSSMEDISAAINEPTEQVLKSIATAGSFLVPAGGGAATSAIGRIGTAAARGAGAGALAGYGGSEEGDELTSILKSAGLGGLVGGALQGVGEISKGIKNAKVPKTGKMAQYGQELRGKAIGLDPNKLATRRGTGIKSVTQGKRTIKGFLDTMDELGIPVGSSSSASVGSDKALKALGGQFDEILGQADEVVRYTRQDTGKLATKIQSAFKNNPSVIKNAQYQELMGDLLGLGDNYTPSQLNMVREKARELINWSTTSKAGVSERASRKVFEVIDDFFKESVPQTKEVLAKMRDIYTVRPFLQTKAISSGTMPLGTASTHMEIPTFGLQEKIPSAIGKTLQKGVSLPQGLPQVLQPLVTAGQRAIPAIPGINQGISEGRQIQQPQQLQPQISQQDQGISAINLMLAQGVLNGQISAAEANAVLSLLGMDAKSTQSNLPKTDTGRKAMVARDAAIGAYQLLQESPDVAGKTAGIENLLYGLTGAANQSTAYKSQIEALRSQMFNALGGSSLTPTEKEQYEKFLPKVTDSAARARQKIEQLVPMLEALMGASISSTETLEQY